MTLYEYLDEAKVIIKHMKQYSLLKNEDAIAFVADKLIKADINYRDLGDFSVRDSFRCSRGKYAVRAWLELQKKNNKKYGTPIDINDKNVLCTVSYQDDTVELSEIMDYINTFNPRTKDMICSYYYDNQTLQEIGNRHKVTRERVRQILESSLGKIKEKFDTDRF